MNLILVASLCFVIAVPTGTYLLLRPVTKHPVLWAIGNATLYVAVGNLFSRYLFVGIFYPDDLHGHSLMGLREMLKIHTIASLSIGVLAALVTAGLVRLVAWVTTEDAGVVALRPPPQTVGQTCVVCDKVIRIAVKAVQCPHCAQVMHKACLSSHECS
jgi:hypothetical protein